MESKIHEGKSDTYENNWHETRKAKAVLQNFLKNYYLIQFFQKESE